MLNSVVIRSWQTTFLILSQPWFEQARVVLSHLCQVVANNSAKKKDNSLMSSSVLYFCQCQRVAIPEFQQMAIDKAPALHIVLSLALDAMKDIPCRAQQSDVVCTLEEKPSGLASSLTVQVIIHSGPLTHQPACL